MAKLFIGTSGWVYKSWKGPFYPTDLPSNKYLAFYAEHFHAAEVNYSFYHLPKPSTYDNWAKQAPKDFIFAVKSSRYITHVKKLHNVRAAWRKFWQNSSHLGKHHGPTLLQFPKNFHVNQKRLHSFLKAAKAIQKLMKNKLNHQLVFEFRHESWFTQEIYDLLKEYNAALCIADSSLYPREDIITADFAYYRFHGPSQLFSSDYPDKQLREEARKIKKLLKKGIDVYVFFNNDAMGHAVKNANTLIALLQK